MEKVCIDFTFRVVGMCGSLANEFTSLTSLHGKQAWLTSLSPSVNNNLHKSATLQPLFMPLLNANISFMSRPMYRV